MKRAFGAAILVSLLLCIFDRSQAQSGSNRTQLPSTQNATASNDDRHSSLDAQANQELQRGTALTQQGKFSEAIPHLLAARGRVANEYAANFNLALSYVGSGAFEKAIPILDDLRHHGHENADVENLLAQAYVGNAQPHEALAALETAAAISPLNEKLYLFVADACTDRQDYALGLKVIAIGLHNLPGSPRLHYERGMLLSHMDSFDRAKREFEFVSKSAGETEIGYVSAAERSLFDGDIAAAIQSARKGLNKGFQTPVLLTILGEALLRSGVSPGQPEFAEAQAALEKSVAERPNDSSSQIALGRLYLAAGRASDAIPHLEIARSMQPDRPAVYAALAKAYQRRGDQQAAQQALATLEKLNLARAEQIRSAPGERKQSYGGGEPEDETPPPHQ